MVVKHYDLARADVKARKLEGPFAGVPLLLKDLNVGLAGTVTTEGSVAFKDQVIEADTTIPARAKAAGMVVFGKTATPEFGLTVTTESKLFGLTRNPWNLKHSAGGSSGGAAAAVAARIVPIANATDGGGSIRIPAVLLRCLRAEAVARPRADRRRQGRGLERPLGPARGVDQRARQRRHARRAGRARARRLHRAAAPGRQLPRCREGAAEEAAHRPHRGAAIGCAGACRLPRGGRAAAKLCESLGHTSSPPRCPSTPRRWATP